MDTLILDLRYGIRTLVRKPGFTAVAIVTLALGIGANSAIFSVVNAVLLRRLPYKDPTRLVGVWATNRNTGENQENANDRLFVAWRDRNQVFESIAGYLNWSFTLTGGGEPERLDGAIVTAGFFSTLEASPFLGRTFQRGEDDKGKDDVVVLSFGMWKRRFNSDLGIVGQYVTIDGKRATIVGVMPQSFHSPGGEVELWKPNALEPEGEVQKGIYRTIARLKPGINAAQAQAQLDMLSSQLERERPDKLGGVGARVVGLQEQTVGDIRTLFLVLLGAVGFVLLIACANVANLLLSRSAMRAKEMAIRAALGASRGRVIRQLLTESLLLSVGGGAVGVLLALWGVDALLALQPEGIPRLTEVKLDGQALLFLLGVSLLAGIISGFAPALMAKAKNLQLVLKESGQRSGAGAGRGGLRSVLVIGEAALSLMLLIGAGLLIRSFFNLSSVNPGFDAKNVLTVPVWLSPTSYSDPKSQASFSTDAIDRLSSLPGAQSVAATMFLPLGGSNAHTELTIEDRGSAAAGEQLRPGINVVTPRYYETLRIPIVQGRDFLDSDTSNGQLVAIVNESLARAAWPGKEPVGKRLLLGEPDKTNPWFTVVGVVGDTRDVNLRLEAAPELYFSYEQTPFVFPLFNFVIRTANDPEALISAARTEIWKIDKDQPLYDVKTMRQRVMNSASQDQFQLLLLCIFAAVALILAVIGLYGVVSYSVAQRTHEVGIRMALGAERRSILGLMMKQGAILIGTGIATGLTGAFFLTRVMQSFVFGIKTYDAVTFSAVSLLLALAGLLAAYIPARRATRVDPIEALRYE